MVRWNWNWGAIQRDRWNFSPHGSTREIEDYQVSIEHVSPLALMIEPSGNDSFAILSSTVRRKREAICEKLPYLGDPRPMSERDSR